LTHDPAGEFRSIFEFLGEPFEQSAVQEHAPHLKRWYGDPYLWGPIVARTKSWDEYMTSGEADFVQYRLSRIMRTLGYVPYDGVR
jgi:hypothetical protein